MTTTNTFKSKLKSPLKKAAKSTNISSIPVRNEALIIKETPPQPSKYRNLQAFFILNGATTQQFQIEANQPVIIEGRQGINISLAAHSFVNVAHQPVTGKIMIRIKEVFSKSDMVLSNKPTTSQNRLLTSGGTFFISATKRNLPLQLVRPAEVYLPITKKITNPAIMQVFRGSRSSSNLFEDKPQFDWKKSHHSRVEVASFKKKPALKVTLNELNWINCDHFYRNDIARSMLTVQTAGLDRPLQEQVTFLVFKNIHGVMRLYRKQHKFSMYNVPTQETATIVSIGIDDAQQLYFGKQEIERTTSEVIPLMMRPINEDLLVKICRTLD